MIKVDQSAAAADTNTYERCVKVKFTTIRKMLTGDNKPAATTDPEAKDGKKTYDIDWEFRTYAITTGWRIDKDQATNPGSQDFAAKTVDFYEFFRAA